MINPDKPSTHDINNEDEFGADINHAYKVNNETVDGIKTGDKKQQRYYDKPFDEQMYNSFDEIREQNNIEDEEAD